MIGVVEGVEKVFVERMNILQPWKAIEDGLKFFAKCFRGKLDLSCVESFAIVRDRLMRAELFTCLLSC